MLLDTVKNLKEVIKQYKLLFAIFFTGVTITVVGLLYLFEYNNLLLIDGRDNLTMETKCYSFTGKIEGEELNNLLSRIEQEFLEEERMGIFLFTDEKVEVEEYQALGSICGSYGDVNEKFCGIVCGEFIKKEEDRKVLVNDVFFMKNNMADKSVGDKLKVQGTDLEIAGIGALNVSCDDGSLPDLMLPYQTFLKLCNHVSRVDLILNKPLKKTEYKRLDNLLNEEITYEKPVIMDLTFGMDYLSRFLTSSVLIILALSSLMGLYQYILMERRKEFAIYRILGMTNHQLFQRVAIEINILLCMNCLLGTIIILEIQMIWKNTIFSSMYWYDYAIGYIIIILCGWIASIPLFRKMKKQDIFQQYVTGEDT